MHIATVRDAGGWGDVCCCMWAQAGLRRMHPHAVLHWWCLDQYRDLAERCPDIDRRHTMSFHRRRSRNAPLVSRSIPSKVERLGYEKVVDLFCPCPAHERFAPDVDQSRIELFCAAAGVPVTHGRYFPTVADREWLAGALPARPYVMFAPFAQSHLRSWNAEQAVLFAKACRMEGLRLIYVDTWKPHLPRVHEAQKALAGLCTPLIRASYWQLMVALEVCDLYVGADSGPLHAAGIMDVPILGLFGMTGGATTLKHYGDAMWICAPPERQECGVPCYSRRDRGFSRTECNPPDKGCECLRKLTAGTVLTETIRWLKMTGEEKCESQEVACAT